MKKSLWQPSNLKKQNSLIKDFFRFANLESTDNFLDLWKWSIQHPELFWSKFWDYSKIIGDKGKEVIKSNQIFRKTQFFPDSKINYTENILRKKNDDIAIGFLSLVII